jgi:signal transduction histidine kinase
MRRVLWSVPVRAAVAASVVVATALAVAGFALLGVLRADLSAAAAAQAAADANRLAMMLEAGTSPSAAVQGSSLSVAVVDLHGRLLAISPGVTAESLHGVVGTAPAAAGASPVSSTGAGHAAGEIMPDAASSSPKAAESAQAVPASGPVFAEAFTKVHGTPAIVYAAVSDATESSALAAARTAMLVGLPLLLAVVAAVTWLVTRRALRPVEHIRDELSAIMDSTDLARRVPEPPAQDAIGRLARTTNQTLAALETSLAQQHRFVADASHELRNPIASLRTQLEVGAAHPALLDVPGAVKDVARLQQLATDLLLLARLDAGERPPAPARVDLAELARKQVALVCTANGGADSEVNGGGRVPVRVGTLTDLEVTGSERQLARILANLIDNARRHAATEVVVSIRGAGDDRAVLDVADDGDGVPADQRERIFERFVRLDDARSRDDGGAGLGLAIARDLARRHGGTLTMAGREDRGAVFTLELPLWSGRADSIAS